MEDMVRNDMDREMMSPEIREHVVAGTLGALVGALIGVAAILLLGRIGLVASIAGAAMAVCSLRGYEMLGKMLSKRGVIICSVIMFFMVIVAEYLDWTISLYKELNDIYGEVDFAAVLIVLPQLLSESGLVGKFFFGLAVLYVFTALGAVPKIRSILPLNPKNAVYERSTGLRDRAFINTGVDNKDYVTESLDTDNNTYAAESEGDTLNDISDENEAGLAEEDTTKEGSSTDFQW